MFTAQQYVKAATLEEAWQLNQKRSTTLLAGGCWLRLTRRRVGALVDLSGLGLDTIEETEGEFSLGAMVTLRQLETNEALNGAFGGLFKEMTRHIVAFPTLFLRPLLLPGIDDLHFCMRIALLKTASESYL